jgi:ClpA/ClpB-like protein
MFERYTEKARRVIFFARYEASQYGSPEIDTEHLLLGLTREESRIGGWLPKAKAEVIRKHIESSAPQRQSIATNVDLPLSTASKRVLYHAKDEADRLNNKYIGTEHLFLGLVQERESLAGKVLHELGGDVAKLRQKLEGEIERVQPAISTTSDLSRRLRSAIAQSVEIHGTSWDADYIDTQVKRCRAHNWHWHKAEWKPRDVVIEARTGRYSFDLSLVEEAGTFQLVKGGWKKDHCAICRWELFESQDNHGSGYTNGRDWVCLECYDRFWQLSGSYSDIT